MFMERKFIQIKEASEILGVTKLTLRNWDNNGKLKTYRNPINNYRVYKVKDIEDFINNLKPSNPKIMKEAPTPPYKEQSKIFKIKVKHL